LQAYSKLGQLTPRGTNTWRVRVSTMSLPTTFSRGAAAAVVDTSSSSIDAASPVLRARLRPARLSHPPV
jgi:hypothetical protein